MRFLKFSIFREKTAEEKQAERDAFDLQHAEQLSRIRIERENRRLLWAGQSADVKSNFRFAEILLFIIFPAVASAAYFSPLRGLLAAAAVSAACGLALLLLKKDRLVLVPAVCGAAGFIFGLAAFFLVRVE